MSKVYSLHIRKHLLVYLDNIIVYNSTLEQHYKDLEAVFATIAQPKLLAKHQNASFTVNSCLS